jgi:hypothetical protein
MLYFFAGFFAVHGWPFNTLVTSVLFFSLHALAALLTGSNIVGAVPENWRWLVQNFRFLSGAGKVKCSGTRAHPAFMCRR